MLQMLLCEVYSSLGCYGTRSSSIVIIKAQGTPVQSCLHLYRLSVCLSETQIDIILETKPRSPKLFRPVRSVGVQKAKIAPKSDMKYGRVKVAERKFAFRFKKKAKYLQVIASY